LHAKRIKQSGNDRAQEGPDNKFGIQYRLSDEAPVREGYQGWSMVKP